MKPAMERLMYEILGQVYFGGQEKMTLDVLNQRFDADLPAKKERVRNAVARLCSAGHLKKHGGRYIFLKGMRGVPSEVASLFPGRNMPSEKAIHPPISTSPRPSVEEKKPAPSQVQEDEVEKSSGRGRPAKLREWILKTLAEDPGPHSTEDLAFHAVKQGISRSEASATSALARYCKQGLIERSSHGYYQAKKVSLLDKSLN